MQGVRTTYVPTEVSVRQMKGIVVSPADEGHVRKPMEVTVIINHLRVRETTTVGREVAKEKESDTHTLLAFTQQR